MSPKIWNCMTWLPLSTSFVPFYFPLSALFFIFFVVIYLLTQNQCVNFFLSLHFLLSSQEKEQTTVACLQLFNPSIIVPTFFLSSKRTCVMVIHIAIISAMKRVIFFPFLAHTDESTHVLRTFVPDKCGKNWRKTDVPLRRKFCFSNAFVNWNAKKRKEVGRETPPWRPRVPEDYPDICHIR